LQLAPAFQLLGKAHAQQGDKPQAIAAYKRATQLYLELADKANARLCLDQIESLQPARSTNPTAIAARQTSVLPVTMPDFLQKIRQQVEQGRQLDALTDLNWLLHLEPNHVEALCLLGTIHAQSGATQAAMQAIARARNINPTSRDVQLQCGIIRSLLGDAHGAIADFTQLIHQNNRDAQGHFQRAQSYAQIGAWENAFKDYSNAIGITPQNAAAYFGRAAVQRAMDDLEASIDDYQQAASCWFNRGDFDKHQKALALVKQLRETLQSQKAATAAAAIIRVPIKYRLGGIPIIEAVFNGQYTFDVMLDTGASRTLISQKMAYILKIQPTGHHWGRVANGQEFEFESGWVQSLAVGAAVVQNLQVMIADQDVEALLGQDFLGSYHIRLLTDVIEFHR